MTYRNRAIKLAHDIAIALPIIHVFIKSAARGSVPVRSPIHYRGAYTSSVLGAQASLFL